MSQSPTAESNLPSDSRYLGAWQDLARRIQNGSSFSGRERNCVFINTQQTRFADASSILGLDHLDDSRTFAVVDWDHDGDLDLWQANRTGPRIRFLRNDLERNSTNFVALRLVGDPAAKVNRDAIGSRVKLTLRSLAGDEREIVRTLYAGDSFLSQSSKWIHFGFRKDESIQSVQIRWPGQTTFQTFENLKPNSRYVLNLGSQLAEAISTKREPVNLIASNVSPAKLDERARLKLSSPEPISPFTYKNANGVDERIAFDGEKPHLIILWATWCQPCIDELKELASHEASLKQLGVHVLALNVEALDESVDDASAVSLVRTWQKKNRSPFLLGLAPAGLISELDQIRGKLIYRHRQLPIPSAFIIDRQGRLRTMFTGGMTFADLADVTQILNTTPDATTNESRNDSLPFSGRWAEDIFVTNPIVISEAYRQDRQFADARDYLQKHLDSEPEPPSDDQSERASQARLRLSDVHYFLALNERSLRSGSAAVGHLKKSLQLNPRQWRALDEFASTLTASGQDDDAAKFFARSIAINPKNANAANQIGLIRMKQKRFLDSANHFREALRADPRWMPAANNLAWLMATCPDEQVCNGAQAVMIAKQLAQATQFQRPDILDTLAAAYAETGDFTSAQKTILQAIEQSHGAAAEQQKKLELRHQLYTDKRPYRQN